MNDEDANPLAYNPIFARFVDDDESDNEVLGLVAYGIYKKHKREWAVEFSKRNGNQPTAEDLARYHETWTPGLIENTRQNAGQALAEYAEVAIFQATPDILREALKGSFWRDILVSLLAAFIYTVLLILLVVILAVSGIDLLDILNSLKRNLV